ncbi:MAG: ABC transporter substrate-binding protein [Oscillospiraceae bacterium]|jgi:ABC-type nitrate/sulfonate/bicarbonate transport system substrate-binding protein|nr:ABC transporter substrate-binding protein [Oscillospiraceae bacterium]
MKTKITGSHFMGTTLPRAARYLAAALAAALLFTASGCGEKATGEQSPVGSPSPSSSSPAPSGRTAPETAPSDAPTDAGASPAGEEELFELRAFTPSTFMEFTIADEMGFFRDAGIKIKYVGSQPTGITDLQLIEQGEIDVSYSGHPTVVAQGRLAGLKVKMIVPGMVDGPDNPHVTYLVKEDSPLKTLDDIVGKKVAISGTGVCTDGYLRYYLTQRGLDPDSVEFVGLPQAGQQELAVVEGLVDVTTSHTPYASIALEAGGVRVLGRTWDIFGSPGAGLGARSLPEWIIDEHPDVAQGFVDAMYRARLWSNANPIEAQNLMAAVLGLEEGSVLALLQDENKLIDPSYIDHWVNLAEDIGLWEAGAVAADDIYTNEFVPKDAPESDKTLHWDGLVHNTY